MLEKFPRKQFDDWARRFADIDRSLRDIVDEMGQDGADELSIHGRKAELYLGFLEDWVTGVQAKWQKERRTLSSEKDAK